MKYSYEEEQKLLGRRMKLEFKAEQLSLKLKKILSHINQLDLRLSKMNDDLLNKNNDGTKSQ